MPELRAPTDEGNTPRPVHTSQTMAVRTEFDLYWAQMQVRRLARAIGFDTTNQARVALATSSLARALRLGETQQGRVTIGRLGGVERWGMRVACRSPNNVSLETGSQPFRAVRWLVDELIVEELSPDSLQVTLVALMPRTG
jgi:hypothetical protein